MCRPAAVRKDSGQRITAASIQDIDGDGDGEDAHAAYGAVGWGGEIWTRWVAVQYLTPFLESLTTTTPWHGLFAETLQRSTPESEGVVPRVTRKKQDQTSHRDCHEALPGVPLLPLPGQRLEDGLDSGLGPHDPRSTTPSGFRERETSGPFRKESFRSRRQTRGTTGSCPTDVVWNSYDGVACTIQYCNRETQPCRHPCAAGREDPIVIIHGSRGPWPADTHPPGWLPSSRPLASSTPTPTGSRPMAAGAVHRRLFWHGPASPWPCCALGGAATSLDKFPHSRRRMHPSRRPDSPVRA
ncbi:hypothetical protein QBC39DRAFT_160079 [Podospora conica]|nr:hypothetical protein QBC39DRAFT_160079 [Schizothecium conicum]